MQLDGKRVIVTGASRGIGRAIAIAMAKEGAAVLINYVSHGTEAQEVLREVQAVGVAAAPFQAQCKLLD